MGYQHPIASLQYPASLITNPDQGLIEIRVEGEEPPPVLMIGLHMAILGVRGTRALTSPDDNRTVLRFGVANSLFEFGQVANEVDKQLRAIYANDRPPGQELQLLMEETARGHSEEWGVTHHYRVMLDQPVPEETSQFVHLLCSAVHFVVPDVRVNIKDNGYNVDVRGWPGHEQLLEQLVRFSWWASRQQGYPRQNAPGGPRPRRTQLLTREPADAFWFDTWDFQHSEKTASIFSSLRDFGHDEVVAVGAVPDFGYYTVEVEVANPLVKRDVLTTDIIHAINAAAHTQG